MYLVHHGIKGQEWGVRRGPPYPLDDADEKRLRFEAIAKNGDKVLIEQEKESKLSRFIQRVFPFFEDRVHKTKAMRVYANGKQVGDTYAYDEGNSSLNIQWVGIDDKYRGKGYASAIMNSWVKYAKSKGYKQMTLEVPGNAPDARHIYEKLGFVETGTVLSKEDDPYDVWEGLTGMKLEL